ncbi:hypothetical protein CC78DRAFT_152430 [Lojkania enalia]|uniref:Uncharacterized protein n=1 Tax=Lojkania enalia TaxID=147567 RepID=A0A9P4KHH7_9PLEO|nr:hypothetical protein CC78DRAFT_152430 [Didymosphaeria enalia]
MKVVITSASRPAALALARVLTAQGHTVIGVDYERFYGICPARYSRGYASFFRLQHDWGQFTQLPTDIDLVIPFETTQDITIKDLQNRRPWKALHHSHPIFESQDQFWKFTRTRVTSSAVHVPGECESPPEDGTIYEAHVLINDSHIRTFLVTTLAGGLRPEDFIAIPPTDPLFTIMRSFTESLVRALGVFNQIHTHMTIRFSVEDHILEIGILRKITALSCSNKPHDSIILLSSLKSKWSELASAYTDPKPKASSLNVAYLPNPSGTYSILRVLVEGLRALCLFVGSWGRDWRSLANLVMMVTVWMLYFKEDMWCWHDPLPALVEWFVNVPLETCVWFWERHQKGRRAD